MQGGIYSCPKALAAMAAPRARTETDDCQVAAVQQSANKPTDGVGDPGWIRTSDLQLRRLLLYPLSYGANR